MAETSGQPPPEEERREHPSPEPGSGAAITIRLRRTHLWALAALVLGIALGFVLGRETAEDPRPVLYGLPPSSGSPEAPASESAPIRVETAGRPARGPADAKVTVVEFVDFECPFCGRYARDTLPRLEREYGDRVRYVSRHFPLASHKHADIAAEAAECAHEQGRYWQYHRTLFANQDTLDRRSLVAHARHAGLDDRRLEACLGSSDVRARVRRDVEDGRRYGVTGTPTFFINGRILRGAQPYEQLKAQIESALRDGN